jgi:hypothetical protein
MDMFIHVWVVIARRDSSRLRARGEERKTKKKKKKRRKGRQHRPTTQCTSTHKVKQKRRKEKRKKEEEEENTMLANDQTATAAHSPACRLSDRRPACSRPRRTAGVIQSLHPMHPTPATRRGAAACDRVQILESHSIAHLPGGVGGFAVRHVYLRLHLYHHGFSRARPRPRASKVL